MFLRQQQNDCFQLVFIDKRLIDCLSFCLSDQVVSSFRDQNIEEEGESSEAEDDHEASTENEEVEELEEAEEEMDAIFGMNIL